MKKFYLEELCTACYNLNYEEVVKILKDPLSKSVINQSWAGDDKSYAAPPLIVTLISGVESNSKDTIKIVKALIRNGADVNIVIKLPDINLKQPASMSPLMILMWYKTCDIEIVKFLIQNGADMNFKNEYGMNPLYWAICNPDGTERAKFLISAGADIDIQVNEEKIKGAGVLNDIVIGGVAVTPLQLASKLGKIEIVKELLLNGANTKIKNGYGHDALQLAKQNENEEIFKILSQRNTTWEKENVSFESNEDTKSSQRKSSPNHLITLIEKSSNHEIKIEENANNDSFFEMVVPKDESFETNNEEFKNKDYHQLKEILPQLKKQSQKKDDIILNLRQQLKQLNKTLQEKDKVIQKNNDTVSLIFHIFNDNLKPKEII